MKGLAFVPDAQPGQVEVVSRRLTLVSIFYVVGMLVWVALTLASDAFGRDDLVRIPGRARPLMAVGVAMGVGLILYCRTGPRREVAEWLTVGFLVVGGFILCAAEALAPWPAHGARGLSVASPWILLVPVLAPIAPRRNLVGLAGAVAAGPLAAATFGAAPAPVYVAFFYAPNALVAIIGYFAGRGVYSAQRAARTLGSYKLVRRIGEGGMGEVWRAEHALLSHPAAVKLVRPTRGEGDRKVILARFEREAQITARLTSPHTVKLHDYGVAEDGSVYYVMELIEGLDLEKLVRRFGPVTPARAASFMRQACASLAEAHAVGLIHRDIKPQNLLCARAGLSRDYIKVVDFGLVRPVASVRGVALTEKNRVMGTPGFIAPEAALGGAVDHRSDLYSLACVGYYLVAGAHVFDLGSPLAALHDHAYREPPPLSKRTEKEVPPALEALIMRCLAKDPGRRPADAETLARELEASVPVPWTQADARAFWAEHDKDVPS